MVVSGWHRLPCGAAVLVDDEGRPAQVCDLGAATLDIDDGIFAGDDCFGDMLADDLRELGWDVVLGPWMPVPDDLRTALALALDDDRLVDRAAHSADVLGSESSGPSTPPRRPVPGMPDIEVDRYGSFVVQRLSDQQVRELPLRESGGVLEVELHGETWCVDELVRRAWDDDLSWTHDEGRACS